MKNRFDSNSKGTWNKNVHRNESTISQSKFLMTYEDDVNDGISQDSVIISVIENRAREICICKVNTHNVSFNV